MQKNLINRIKKRINWEEEQRRRAIEEEQIRKAIDQALNVPDEEILLIMCQDPENPTGRRHDITLADFKKYISQKDQSDQSNENS
ncbi:MAG: hypothetical protein IJU20_03640 [Clostridia bacterium]|nr:hypothetical protein [Clostridia bacterium]